MCRKVPEPSLSLRLGYIWSFLEDTLLSLLGGGATWGRVRKLGNRSCEDRRMFQACGGSARQRPRIKSGRRKETGVEEQGHGDNRQGAENPKCASAGKGWGGVAGPGEGPRWCREAGGGFRDKALLLWLCYLTSSSRKHGCRARLHEHTRSELWPPELTWKVKSVLLPTLCPLARISTSADQAPVATVCPSPFPPVIPMVSKLVGISFFNVFSCFYTHMSTCTNTGIPP